MTDFMELKDLYGHVESCAGTYKYSHQLANLFQKLRDLKHKAGFVDEAKLAQWEIECFSFTFRDGELKPLTTMADDKGHLFAFPDISKISDEELDYIEKRLSETSNSILKSRYAHILWESKRKHEKYAKVAVDSYLELVKFYESKDKAEPAEHYGLDVLKSAKNAYALAFQINYRTDDVKAELCGLVREFRPSSSSAFALKASIIDLMLRTKSRFEKDNFTGFQDVCINLADNFFKSGNFHNAIKMFELGEKIENKLGIKTLDWNRRIGESYEGLVDQRGEQDLASVSFCQHAMEYYRKVKDANKVKELEERYDRIRGQQQFQEFSQKIDIKGHVEHCKGIAEKVCQEKPEKIISILISDKSLLPKYKDLEAAVQETAKVAVLSHMAPVVVSDASGHPAEHFVTDDEKTYFHILEQYSWHLQLGQAILLNEIFLQGMKTGKLNTMSVMDFFEKHSWFGKTISKRLPQGQIKDYNWLNLIAPALNEYFNQMEASFSFPDYRPNFVLAMDSLILKIEGLIRDICAISGVTTFYSAKDKQGRNIVREKDINGLLREKPIKDLFDEDDLLFFRYLLVEKAGINLRHKIAHCLADFSEYNIMYMHLVLLALFRLGKYDFKKPDQPIEDKVEQDEELDKQP